MTQKTENKFKLRYSFYGVALFCYIGLVGACYYYNNVSQLLGKFTFAIFAGLTIGIYNARFYDVTYRFFNSFWIDVFEFRKWRSRR